MNLKLFPRLALIAQQMVLDVKTHHLMRGRIANNSWQHSLLEQWSLLWSNGITAEDYYLYGLYQDKPMEKKREFIGYFDRWRWMRQVNPEIYQVLTEDKYIFNQYLSAHGMPVAQVYGTYGPRGISSDGSLLRTPQQFLTWLSDNELENLFIKPVTGTRGVNILSLGKQINTGHWQRFPSGEISGDEIIRHMQQADHLPAYIIEKRLKPHPELAEFADNIAHSARVITSFGEDVKIHVALMRIGMGDKPADNRALGGITCVVDLATGSLSQGCLIDDGICHFIDEHPVSKKHITNTILPGWQQVCELVKKAAVIMNVNGLLAWDVALTDSGPIIIEANEIFDLHWQATAGKGLLDTSMRNYMEENKLLSHIGFAWS